MALLDFLNIGMKVIDKVIPDPAQKAQAQLDLLKLQQEGAFKELDVAVELSKQQTEINNTEAAADNLFKSGWRPFIGWVCGVSLAYQFVALPLGLGIYQIWTGNTAPAFPALDNTLWELLFGMLGLGTLRTIEKLKGK